MTHRMFGDRSRSIDIHWQAQQTWITNTLVVLADLCRTRQLVSVADLWPLVPCPPTKSAMGAVMKEARAQGWIEQEAVSGPYVLGIDAKLHGPVITGDGEPVEIKGLIPAYRSLLYLSADASVVEPESDRSTR